MAALNEREKGGVAPAIFDQLQQHVSELQTFLTAHIEESLALRTRINVVENSRPDRTTTDAIHNFLAAHIINLQELQLSLSGAQSTGQPSAHVAVDKEQDIVDLSSTQEDLQFTIQETDKYRLLGQQFSTLVVISTFTASVVVAFLAIMHDIHTDTDSSQHPASQAFGRVGTYQTGVVLGFLSFSANLGVAVLAGANAVVSTYAAASPTGRRRLIRSRAHRLTFCGYIQLISALSFGLSMLILLNLVLGPVIASLSFVIFMLGILPARR